MMIQTTEEACLDPKNRIREITKIALLVLGFRVAIYLLYFLLMQVSGFSTGAFSFDEYLEGWNRWDASHYLNIAEYGYSHYEENGQHLLLVFLPLYPLLIRLLGLFIIDLRLAGLIVSTLANVVGGIFLYLLIDDEYGHDMALWGVIALQVFPFSFFLNGILTDSLFVALVTMLLFFLKRRSYLMVALLGFLCCLTKLQGGFLAFVVLAELIATGKPFSTLRNRAGLPKAEVALKLWREFLLPGLKCVPMLSGIGVYLGINLLVEGDAFIFMRYQKEHWTHSIGPIWETVRYMLDYVTSEPFSEMSLCIWWPQLILLVLQIGVIVYGLVIKLRPAYIVYVAVFMLVTYSSTWLISGSRYTLSSVPIFIILGILLVRLRRARVLICCALFGLQIIYLLGYLRWMPLM